MDTSYLSLWRHTQSRSSPVILPISHTMFFSIRNNTTMNSDYFSQRRLISGHKVFRAKMLMYSTDFPSLTLEGSRFCSRAFKELSDLHTEEALLLS